MSFDLSLQDGPAAGAYFAEHKLEGGPGDHKTIQVAVDGTEGAALLDLPDDVLELGERIVEYELVSVGFACGRGQRARGCTNIAFYRAKT